MVVARKLTEHVDITVAELDVESGHCGTSDSARACPRLTGLPLSVRVQAIAWRLQPLRGGRALSSISTEMRDISISVRATERLNANRGGFLSAIQVFLNVLIFP